MIEMIVISGLAYSGLYATLAVGFSLVFGVAKILNMAHTGFYMVTAFFIFTVNMIIGVPLVPSAIMGVMFAFILGGASYKFLFDRVKTHETAVLIVSVGLAMLFQEIVLLVFGSLYRHIPPFVRGFIEIAGFRLSYQHLFSICICALILVALWQLLTKTRLGLAIRAIADDPEISNLMGINVGRMCMVTMGMSATIAGVGVLAVAPITAIHPHMWVHPLVMILAIVVLGGLGSIKGSMIAALVLGFSETLVVFLVPGGAYLKGSVSLGIMVIVLLIKPEGIFGIVFEEERL
jgi:branched-chain amino acid transport system permease protein